MTRFTLSQTVSLLTARAEGVEGGDHWGLQSTYLALTSIITTSRAQYGLFLRKALSSDKPRNQLFH